MLRGHGPMAHLPLMFTTLALLSSTCQMDMTGTDDPISCEEDQCSKRLPRPRRPTRHNSRPISSSEEWRVSNSFDGFVCQKMSEAVFMGALNLMP